MISTGIHEATTRRCTGNPEAGGSEPGYAFTGREWDPEIGIYYYRARYYDAGTGRFLATDPVKDFERSAYAYVRNNPARYVDPTGMTAEESCDCAAENARKKVCDLAGKVPYARLNKCLLEWCSKLKARCASDKECSQGCGPNRTCGGYSTQGVPTVNVCSGRSSQCELYRTMYHEVLHICAKEEADHNEDNIETLARNAAHQVFQCPIQ